MFGHAFGEKYISAPYNSYSWWIAWWWTDFNYVEGLSHKFSGLHKLCLQTWIHQSRHDERFFFWGEFSLHFQTLLILSLYYLFSTKLNHWFICQHAFIDLWSMREVGRAWKIRDLKQSGRQRQWRLRLKNEFLPLIGISKMAACVYRLIRRHTSTSA